MYSKLIIFLVFITPLVWSWNGVLRRRDVVRYAEQQYTRLLSTLQIGEDYPTDANPQNSSFPVQGPSFGKAGYMLPGVLWSLYRYTRNNTWKQLAITATDPIGNQTQVQNPQSFPVSFGIAYDITRNRSYMAPIINAADTGVRVFNRTLGILVRSGGSGQTISVDTYGMVWFENLLRAWRWTRNETYLNVTLTSADTLLRLYVRENYTTYGRVTFNRTTGAFIRGESSQGIHPWGWWSRGHLWLLISILDVYKFTRIPKYLHAAEKLADVYIRNLPQDDLISNYDFYSDYPKDTTSASIAAAYFPVLASYTRNITLSFILRTTSYRILNVLFSPKYRADGRPEYNIPALLVNGTHNYPRIDQAINFGDYHFAKALQFLPY